MTIDRLLTKTTPRFFTLACLTLVLLLSGSLTASAQESGAISDNLPGANPHSFIGTWVVQTQITNCSGTTLESFSKLVSIHAGGTVNEVSNSVPASQRTTAFGVWEHLDKSEFVYALRFFRFNPDGTSAGAVQAKWTAEVDDGGDSYTATSAIRIMLPDGTILNRCGFEAATRMEIPQ